MLFDLGSRLDWIFKPRKTLLHHRREGKQSGRKIFL